MCFEFFYAYEFAFQSFFFLIILFRQFLQEDDPGPDFVSAHDAFYELLGSAEELPESCKNNINITRAFDKMRQGMHLYDEVIKNSMVETSCTGQPKKSNYTIKIYKQKLLQNKK